MDSLNYQSFDYDNSPNQVDVGLIDRGISKLMTAVKWEHKQKKKKIGLFSMRDRMCLCREIDIVREKFRVKNHKLGLMLLYSNIYDLLYSMIMYT